MWSIPALITQNIGLRPALDVVRTVVDAHLYGISTLSLRVSNLDIEETFDLDTNCEPLRRLI